MDTEKKKCEKKSSLILFSSLLNRLDLPFIAADEDGVIHIINDKNKLFVSRNPDTYIKQHISSLFPFIDEEKWSEILKSIDIKDNIKINDQINQGRHSIMNVELTISKYEIDGLVCYLLLIQDITRFIREETVHRVLNQISNSVHSAASIQEMFETIRTSLGNLFDTSNFFIAFYDKKTDTITLPYFVDKQDRFEKFPVGKTITGHIIQQQTALLLDKLEINDLARKGIIELHGSPAEIWMGAPLILQDEVKGVLALQSYDDPLAYQPSDLSILKFVSKQVGISIETRKYYDDLIESEKKLREAIAAKDRFFSIIAHDLKSPFTGLLGLSKILNEDINKLSKEEIKELSLDLHTSAENLFKLLENLLQWSRIQRNVVTFAPDVFNLYDVLDITTDLISNNATQKGITVHCQKSDPVYVYADVNMVNTIMRNLLSNAIKFAHRDGNIWIDIDSSGDKVTVSVTDDGVGIPKESLGCLFSIDKNISTLGTCNEEGTGLGLTLCRDLVKKNNGLITVDSTEGHGATFSFTLPKPDNSTIL